jgi:hypothetical protein
VDETVHAVFISLGPHPPTPRPEATPSVKNLCRRRRAMQRSPSLSPVRAHIHMGRSGATIIHPVAMKATVAILKTAKTGEINDSEAFNSFCEQAAHISMSEHPAAA